MAEPMRNRSEAEAIRAYTVIYDELTSKGLKPLFQNMDNEASTALKTFLTARQMKFELIPPHIHRQMRRKEKFKRLKIIS
jgi:hypothetical protein